MDQQRPQTLLGFFMQPTDSGYRNSRMNPPPRSRFLPTSKEGERLKEGDWSNTPLDETLSFIGRPPYICKSSGGLLLCCFELDSPQSYCICNPVTREWRPLPRPNRFHDSSDVAFIGRGGGDTSLDLAEFMVVRARCSGLRTTELELETFSSETGEWRESTLSSAKPLTLRRDCSFAVDGVIYWVEAESGGLVAYDLATERLVLIELAVGGGDRGGPELWGSTEGGRIHCVRHDGVNLEVCNLETKKMGFGYELVLVARVSLAAVFQLRPEMAEGAFNYFGIIAIHPRDRRLVLLRWNYEHYWCNVENGVVVHQLDNTTADRGLPARYFPYEWPSAAATSH